MECRQEVCRRNYKHCKTNAAKEKKGDSAPEGLVLIAGSLTNTVINACYIPNGGLVTSFGCVHTTNWFSKVCTMDVY